MTLFLPTNTHQYVRTLVASVSDVTGTDIKDVKLLFDVPRPAPKTVEEEEEREGEPAYVSCRVFSPVVATCRHPPELSDACARAHTGSNRVGSEQEHQIVRHTQRIGPVLCVSGKEWRF